MLLMSSGSSDIFTENPFSLLSCWLILNKRYKRKKIKSLKISVRQGGLGKNNLYDLLKDSISTHDFYIFVTISSSKSQSS